MEVGLSHDVHTMPTCIGVVAHANAHFKDAVWISQDHEHMY